VAELLRRPHEISSCGATFVIGSIPAGSTSRGDKQTGAALYFGASVGSDLVDVLEREVAVGIQLDSSVEAGFRRALVAPSEELDDPLERED